MAALKGRQVITSPDTREILEIPYHMAQLLARTAAMTTLVKQGHCLMDICRMLDENPKLVEDELARVLDEHRKTPT